MKHWKKIAKLFLLTACIGLFAGCGQNGTQQGQEPTATVVPEDSGNAAAEITVPAAKPVEVDPEALTGLSAFEITSRMVVGWNLGNSLDSTGGNVNYFTLPKLAVRAWGNEEPTQELIAAVKEGGFNTVRIPTTWYQHIRYDKPSDSYIINEKWLAYVKEVVDYAYDLDMFVILNVHHEDWVNVDEFTEESYAKAAQMLEDIWGQVAETFAGYGQHLIFEGMNEPRQVGLGGTVEWGGGDAASQKYVNDLNKVFVDAIRGQGSDFNKERLLMLPGYAASSNIPTIKSIVVPENSGNVALSVHAYFPYTFAMDSSSAADHTFPGKNNGSHATSIKSLFNSLKQISEEKNVPIIIGECGASDFNNTEDRARWATCFMNCAKEAGIPCVLWDNQATFNGTGEAYGLISRKNFTWFTNSIPMIKAIMEVYGQASNLPEEKTVAKQPFDWADIPVEADWVEIYRNETGLAIDTWGNLWLENWQPYLNAEYDIVMVYESEDQPYMVLQPVWHKVFAEEKSDSPYMIRFTFADTQNTMTAENVKLENVTGYFASANSKPMKLYGVFAVPVK